MTIAVSGPCEGVGMTEVAVSLALSLAAEVATVLVDLDQAWPSVAQRLDLPVHPNIRTAIDHAQHRPDRLEQAIHWVDELGVVTGRADGGAVSSITRHEVVAVLDALSAVGDVVVADLGPIRFTEGGLAREFDTMILVGAADPVGVTRLLRTIELIRSSAATPSLLCVLNKVPPGAYQRSEAVAAVEHSFPEVPVVAIPHDPRLALAAWDGVPVSGRRHRRVMKAVSDVVIRAVS